MSSQYFEGAAGTGKTYSLMRSLEELARARNLEKHQKILALTFMHGSRARLDDCLSELIDIKKRFDCMTFDAFAGYIVNRWRDLLNDLRQKTEMPISDNEYDQVCFEAAELLKYEDVQRWVSLTHPIVLVDEAQDLSPARLAIMQNLASSSVLLVAADEYQHLNEDHNGNEAVQWLSGNINTIRLTQARRTNDHGLLQVAHSLRNGEAVLPLLKDGSFGRKELGNFSLLTVPTWQLLAWQAGFALHFNSGNHAILTLSADDQISNKALDRLRLDSQHLNRRQGTVFGPFHNLKHERKTETLVQECILSLGLPDRNLSLKDALGRCNSIEDLNIRGSVYSWISKRRKKVGQTEFSKDEFNTAINNAFQNKRRYHRGSNATRKTMTIHQAKNREFDNVIVMWTFALASGASDEYKRRLLYNAITRARRKCTVIVIGANRINEAPFSLPEAQSGIAE